MVFYALNFILFLLAGSLHQNLLHKLCVLKTRASYPCLIIIYDMLSIYYAGSEYILLFSYPSPSFKMVTELKESKQKSSVKSFIIGKAQKGEMRTKDEEQLQEVVYMEVVCIKDEKEGQKVVQVFFLCYHFPCTYIIIFLIPHYFMFFDVVS